MIKGSVSAPTTRPTRRREVRDRVVELLRVRAGDLVANPGNWRRHPQRQRAALVLRFYADLPGNEIATILGCREGTVKSLIHRGLARLREEVGE